MALLMVFIIDVVWQSGIITDDRILGLRLLILAFLCSCMIYIKELFLRVIYLLNFNDSKMRERQKNIISMDLPNALIVLENDEEMTM